MPDSARKARPRMIGCRVSKEIYDLVNRAAESDRRTVADWVRIVIEDAAKRQLDPPDKPTTKR